MGMKKQKVYLTEEKIGELVKSLAKEINSDYKDKELTILCVANAGYMFFSDLTKHIVVKHTIGFIKPSKTILGSPQIIAGSIKENIILVDTINDTGSTFSNLTKSFLPHLRIETACLIQKYNTQFNSTYMGAIYHQDKWLYGYGLDDDNGMNRNLKEIRFL